MIVVHSCTSLFLVRVQVILETSIVHVYISIAIKATLLDNIHLGPLLSNVRKH